MKTITFYSYKGGVGRSLALSQVAIRLSEYGKKVCVLDFDLEAPGLHFKFHNYDKATPIEKGIVDYISEFNTTGKIPKFLKDFHVRLKPKNQTYENIDLIPAGNIELDEYWLKLSQINWSSLFYNEHSIGVKFFLDLKARIKKELNPDFLLIDSRTGITDIAGITLRLLADEAVILAANNEENIFGSKKIIKSLIDPERALFGTSPKIHFVLTRLPFTDEPRERAEESNRINRVRKELTSYLGLESLDISVIHSDRRLEKTERHLMGYEMEEKSVSISNDYLKLFDKLTSTVLSMEEKSRFENLRKAEINYGKSLQESDFAKKIQLLNNAIELNPNNIDYFRDRGDSYWSLGEFEKAVSDLNAALSFDPSNIYLIHSLGRIFSASGKMDDSVEHFKKAIKLNPLFFDPYIDLSIQYSRKNENGKAIALLNGIIPKIPDEDENLHMALNARANIYREEGKYSEALEDIFLAIQLEPNEKVYFATLAEIYAGQGRLDEFYSNLSIALSKGITDKDLNTAKDLYERFKDDEKLLRLLDKYGQNINIVIG